MRIIAGQRRGGKINGAIAVDPGHGRPVTRKKSALQYPRGTLIEINRLVVDLFARDWGMRWTLAEGPDRPCSSSEIGRTWA